jgi:hypothetical protein
MMAHMMIGEIRSASHDTVDEDWMVLTDHENSLGYQMTRNHCETDQMTTTYGAARR